MEKKDKKADFKYLERRKKIKYLRSLLTKIVRARDKWCLRCHTMNGLQAAHIYPKGKYRKMEFDPDNVIGLCWSCHMHWAHKDVRGFNKWLEETLPKERLKRLDQRAKYVCRSPIDLSLVKIDLENELKKYSR